MSTTPSNATDGVVKASTTTEIQEKNDTLPPAPVAVTTSKPSTAASTAATLPSPNMPSYAQLLAENTHLKASNATLRAENTTLKARAARLRSELSKKRPTADRFTTEKQRTRLFEKFIRVLRTTKGRIDGSGRGSIAVVEKTLVSPEEFALLFSTHPDAKVSKPSPRSPFTFCWFATWEAVQSLFGTATLPRNGYKAAVWLPNPNNHAADQAHYMGDVSVQLCTLKIEYSKAKHSLTLIFFVQKSNWNEKPTKT